MPCLSPEQFEFLTDRTTTNLAYVGGMGVGKSLSGALKAIDLALSNPGHPGIVWAPTIRDAREGVIKTAVQILRGDHDSEFHIPVPFDFNKSTGTITLKPKGRRPSEILVRSGEQDIVGTNAAWAIADELDTISKGNATHTWQQLTQRVRVGSVRQLCATTTPEGFRFCYEFFVAEPAKEPHLRAKRRLIQASLFSNPNIDDGYIQNLMDSHSAQQIRARVHGEFVNMTTGSVYPDYDAELNHTNLTFETLPDSVKTLHIGMDFNVKNPATHPHGIAIVVSVVMNGCPYVIEEMYGSSRTVDAIKQIRGRFPGKTILVYPDATASGDRTSASDSDRAQLQAAGFVDMSPMGNPRIEDRVNAVNALILNGAEKRRLRINKDKCPVLSNCLQQQPYDQRKNTPEKDTGFDDPIDALGYFVNVNWPVKSGSVTRQTLNI